jgi:hypothetical protein
LWALGHLTRRCSDILRGAEACVTWGSWALGMGKMILFRELVLSVQFTIMICLFDSVVLIRSLRQITS